MTANLAAVLPPACAAGTCCPPFCTYLGCHLTLHTLCTCFALLCDCCSQFTLAEWLTPGRTCTACKTGTCTSGDQLTDAPVPWVKNGEHTFLQRPTHGHAFCADTFILLQLEFELSSRIVQGASSRLDINKHNCYCHCYCR